MTLITGTFETSRSFKTIFGETDIANFTYYPEIHALIINGKGLFVADFKINQMGYLSFLFIYNNVVTTIRNGRLVKTEIEDNTCHEYLTTLYNLKAIHLSALCKLWFRNT